MTNLGSVINGILNGLAYSRYQSDLTTKQLAEQYQKDPLLSLFPVPRMDFTSVEADITLVLNEVVQQEPTPEETPPTLPYPPQEDLPTSLKANVTNETNQLASSLLKIFTDQLNLPTSKRSNVGKALPTLHNKFVEEIYKFKEEEVKNTLISQPILPTDPTPILRRPIGSEIRVGVTPTEIEKAAPAALGKIKLQMGVQNYEWIEVERNESGGSIQKLTPTGR